MCGLCSGVVLFDPTSLVLLMKQLTGYILISWKSQSFRLRILRHLMTRTPRPYKSRMH